MNIKDQVLAKMSRNQPHPLCNKELMDGLDKADGY